MQMYQSLLLFFFCFPIILTAQDMPPIEGVSVEFLKAKSFILVFGPVGVNLVSRVLKNIERCEKAWKN